MLQPTRAPNGGDIDDDKYAKKQFRYRPVRAVLSCLLAISLSLTLGYVGSMQTHSPKIASSAPIDETNLPYSTVQCSHPRHRSKPGGFQNEQCHFENVCWKDNKFVMFSPRFSMYPSIAHENGSWLEFEKKIHLGFGQDPQVVPWTIDVVDSSLPKVDFVDHLVVYHDISGGHPVEPGELTFNSWFTSMLLVEQFFDPIPDFIEVKLGRAIDTKIQQRLWADYGGAIFGKVNPIKENTTQCFKNLLVGTNVNAPSGFMRQAFKGYFLHNPTLRRMRNRVRKSVGFSDVKTLKILFVEKKTSYWWNWNFIGFDNITRAFKNKYPTIPMLYFTPEEASMESQLKMYTESMIVVNQAGGISMMNFLIPDDGVEIIISNHQEETECGDEDAVLRNSISYIRTYKYCFPGHVERGVLQKRVGHIEYQRQINATKFMKLVDLAIDYECRLKKFENCA